VLIHTNSRIRSQLCSILLILIIIELLFTDKLYLYSVRIFIIELEQLHVYCYYCFAIHCLHCTDRTTRVSPHCTRILRVHSTTELSLQYFYLLHYTKHTVVTASVMYYVLQMQLFSFSGLEQGLCRKGEAVLYMP